MANVVARDERENCAEKLLKMSLLLTSSSLLRALMETVYVQGLSAHPAIIFVPLNNLNLGIFKVVKECKEIHLSSCRIKTVVDGGERRAGF